MSGRFTYTSERLYFTYDDMSEPVYVEYILLGNTLILTFLDEESRDVYIYFTRQ
jgi:hypothetical protein